MTAPDWYPDPTGRFEFRYHNGQAWTDDVSRGGVRGIDPLYAPDRTLPVQAPRDRRATAAMVLGIISICLTWMPVFFVVGVVCAVLAIIFGVRSRRRQRLDGQVDTRGYAGVGIITGIVGLVVALVGVWFTVVVYRAVERFDSPPPSSVDITACRPGDGSVTVGGTLTNLSSDDSEFRVVVRVPTASGRTNVSIDVGSVDAGAEAEFSQRVRSSATEIATGDCTVVAVTGPYPFGVAVDR